MGGLIVDGNHPKFCGDVEWSNNLFDRGNGGDAKDHPMRLMFLQKINHPPLTGLG